MATGALRNNFDTRQKVGTVFMFSTAFSGRCSFALHGAKVQRRGIQNRGQRATPTARRCTPTRQHPTSSIRGSAGTTWFFPCNGPRISDKTANRLSTAKFLGGASLQHGRISPSREYSGCRSKASSAEVLKPRLDQTSLTADRGLNRYKEMSLSASSLGMWILVNRTL